MLDLDNIYTITIKSNDTGKYVECNDKIDALAQAIAMTLTLKTDTQISEEKIENFCNRITSTLKKWDKELNSLEN